MVGGVGRLRHNTPRSFVGIVNTVYTKWYPELCNPLNSSGHLVAPLKQ